MAAALLLVLYHVLYAEGLPVIAHVLVELLRRVRQDRRQDRLQAVHHTQDDVDAHRRRVAIPLDLEPG
jgi:hypothetical protein